MTTGDPGRDVAADVHSLVAALLPVLAPTTRFSAEQGVLIIPAGEGGRARASTASLVHACAQQPRAHWPRLVDAWLRDRTEQAERIATTSADKPDDDLDLLRLRVVPKLDQNSAGRFAIYPCGPHFDTLLVFDHPDRVAACTPAQAGRLGDRDVIRTKALANTLEHELKTFDVRDFEVAATESMRVIAKDDSLYVPTALLALGDYLSGPAPYGALLSVPRYSMMFLHEVRSDRALSVLGVFQDMTTKMYESAADACSPYMFWWVSGDVHPVRVSSARGGMPQVDLAPELQPIVENLPPDGVDA